MARAGRDREPTPLRRARQARNRTLELARICPSERRVHREIPGEQGQADLPHPAPAGRQHDDWRPVGRDL